MALTNAQIAAKYTGPMDKIVHGMVKDFRANGLADVDIARNVIGALAIAAIEAGRELGATPHFTTAVIMVAVERVINSSTAIRTN